MDSSIIIIIIDLFYIFRKKIKITKKQEKISNSFYTNLIIICALSFYVDEKYDSKTSSVIFNFLITC